MSLTKDPIFKSIMFALLVGYLAIVSQSVWAAKGGKPEPGPVVAEDLDCVGCVDTGDIADGAVTTDKVSAELLDTISLPNDRIDALEARHLQLSMYQLMQMLRRHSFHLAFERGFVQTILRGPPVTS